MKIEGFILDIDNTLIKSTEAHYQSWKHALENNGIQVEKEKVIKEFGRPTSEIAKTLAKGNKELGKKIAEEKTDFMMDYLDKAEIFPDTKEILQDLKDNSYKICYASSNFNRIIEKFMKIFELGKYTELYVGIDDIENGKPDPEMIHVAITKLNLSPEKCVMIGDSLYDVEAGNRAGTKTIAVCTGHNDKEAFKPYNPNLILDKFSDLKEYLPLDL